MTRTRIHEAATLTALAIVAWGGETVLGVPAYPEAEPEAMFDVRMGERMLVTDDPLPLVREFYLPFVHKVFMDHDRTVFQVGRVGRQR